MEDEKIVEMFFARNENAVKETGEKYGAYCRKIALNIIGSEQDAQECENDTYSAAWGAIPPGHPENLKAYLAKTVRNIALNRSDYLRAAKRCGSTAPLDELSEIVSGKESVEGSFEQGEIAEAISTFMREQNALTRAAFVRRYFCAESLAEISRCTGLSMGAVKSLLFRTRKKLKAHLEREGYSL